jgi:hypothetical protein
MILMNGNIAHKFEKINSVSDTVHDIKRGSSFFIKRNNLVPGKFSWQEGYGGFTYCRSQ